MDEDEVLAVAAGVEADSEHPLARATVAGAERRGIHALTTPGFENLAGRGASATIAGTLVYVGGPRLLEELAVELPSYVDSGDRRLGRCRAHGPG